MTYPLALEIGTILAKDYRIENILGAGGSGITYIAREIPLNRNVAIKEYFPGDFAIRQGEHSVCAKTESDEEDYNWGLERFIEEAQTLAKFDHANIVKVYRYFQAHNTAYMVLKFEEGMDFKTWLGDLDRPPEQEELDKIVTPLLNALELIHKDNFLHRDIAPDNIIIRNDGSPVLIDFGSARRVISNRPKTVSALIKPGYSPFEQYAMTGKNQGPWTDIYSLGATLYHAVTGERPMDSPTRMIGDELISAKKAANHTYRKGFLQAIDLAMKLKAKDRPQDISAWRDKLFSTGSASARKKQQSKTPVQTLPKEKKATEVTANKKSNKELALPDVAPARKISQNNLIRNAYETGELLANKISRNTNRAFIRFLAEYARPEKHEELQKAGSLIGKLGKMNSNKGTSDLSLEEQLKEKQSETLEKLQQPPVKKRKANLIKKILSTPPEPEKQEKPKPAPNKSFTPEENSEKEEVTDQKPEKEQKLVTVRLKRKKINVQPGPTTQARQKLISQAGTSPARRKYSKFFLALRVMQLLMIIAIVLPIVYIFSLQEQPLKTGSISNPEKKDLAAVLNGHYNTVTSLAFSPDGDKLISAGNDNNIRVWDSYSGKQIDLLSAHREDISSVSVTPENILSADIKGELILWDLSSGKALKNFSGHTKKTSAVIFTENRNKFISAGADQRIKVWNKNNTRKETYSIFAHNQGVNALAYSARRRLIASSGNKNNIKLWRIGTGRLQRIYPKQRGRINTLAFSINGKYLAAGGQGQIKIWSAYSKRLYRVLGNKDADIHALKFSPNGLFLAAAGKDNQIRIWNWRSGTLVKSFAGHTDTILSLTFAPDSRRIASAGKDHTIRIWNLPQTNIR